MKTITTAPEGNEQTAQAVPEKAAPAKKTPVSKKATATKKRASSKKGKKTTKPAPRVKKAAGAAREGSKTAKVLDLLKRPKGATLKDIMKATSRQAHSVGGFLSTAAKKLGLKIESTKTEAGDRVYQIKK